MRFHSLSRTFFCVGVVPVFALVIGMMAPAGGCAGTPGSLWRDRTVVFVVGHEGVLSRASDVRQRESRLEVHFELESGESARPMALYVPGCEDASVLVNGREVCTCPVRRDAGLVFLVPAVLLQEHGNVLSVGVPSARKSGGWNGTALFRLDDTTDEIHFAAVFGDPEPRVAPPADPTQAWFDVLWYDCSWTPSMSDSVLTSASVTVGARSLDSSLQTIMLDFDPNDGQMIVARADQGEGTPALPFTADNTTKRLSITLPAPVTSSTQFQVRVQYSGRPATGGAFGAPYRRTTHSGVPVVYTFSQPYGGRKWWPCKDLPDDKALTSTQRITIPSGQGYSVVSNGVLAGIESQGATETWTWRHGYPISSYLISLSVTNYNYCSSTYTSRDGLTTMIVKHGYYPEYAASEGQAATGTVQVMNFFADTFGEYPFLAEKYYTASFGGSGMEHQTCTGIYAGGVGNGLSSINVHELMHQWFGDKVTCSTFDHVWIHEGFAKYSEALWYGYASGTASYHSVVNGWTVTTTVPVVGPNADAFASNVVYRKGAWVLHMLRHVIGDDAFFRSLRHYINDPELSYGLALTNDFKRIAEEESSQTLTSFFNQWLYRPGSDAPGTGGLYEPSAQPTYFYYASARSDSGDNYLDLHIGQTQAGTPYVMQIDIRMTGLTGGQQTIVVSNATASQDVTIPIGSFRPGEIDFDPDNWLLESRALSINTCGLPDVTPGQPYSHTLHASHGSGAYSWSTPGPLPQGITLGSSGVLSGSTTKGGMYVFPVTVSSGGSTRTVSLRLWVPFTGARNWQLLE